MEKILINNHAYFLGFELFHYKEEFDVKKVENFLLENVRKLLTFHLLEGI